MPSKLNLQCHLHKAPWQTKLIPPLPAPSQASLIHLLLERSFPQVPIPLCTLLHLAVLPQPRRSAPAVPSSLVSCLAGPPHLPSPAPSGQFSVPTSTRNSATLSHLARSSSSFWMIPAKTPPPHLPISPRIYHHASDPDPQQVGVGALSAKVGRCPRPRLLRTH